LKSKIKRPDPSSIGGADDLSLDEQLDLTPTKRAEYQHLKLVERLERHLEIVRGEREEHKMECVRLQKVERLHIALTERYRGDRWRDAGVVIAMAVGAGVMETWSNSDTAIGIGWTLVGLAGLYQLARSTLGTK